MKQLKLSQQIKNYQDGKYNSPDRATQINAGWYDWFCRETALAAKTEKLYGKLLRIAESKKIDKEKMYVFFKNNCPMNGTLYDDFRLCDSDTGNVIYTITPSCGHTSNKGTAEVWGKENGFKEPIVSGKWRDVLNFFNKQN